MTITMDPTESQGKELYPTTWQMQELGYVGAMARPWRSGPQLCLLKGGYSDPKLENTNVQVPSPPAYKTM